MSEYCKNCFELQNKIDELEMENARLVEDLGIANQILQEIKEYLEDIDYVAQFDGTPYDLLQTKTDEYIKEVQYRYKRRYSIKNIILRKVRGFINETN